MSFLMLSCKHASELIDKSAVVKLSMREKVILHVHTKMCDACAAYQKQSKILGDALHKHINSLSEDVPAVANPELKQRIISKL